MEFAALFQAAQREWSTLGRYRLVSWIRDKKLAGQVLRRRSGTLARSIESESEILEDGSGFSIGTNVIYGIGWENGFHRPAFRVIARNAKALRIALPDGRVIFRKSARIPAKTFGARPFIRPSIDENREYLLRLAERVTVDAVQKAQPNRTIVIGGAA